MAFGWTEYAWACEMAHRVAEKSIKALVFYYGVSETSVRKDPRWRSHKLGDLLDLSVEKTERETSSAISQQVKNLQWLNPIQTRYVVGENNWTPSERFQRTHAEAAIPTAGHILEEVKQLVS